MIKTMKFFVPFLFGIILITSCKKEEIIDARDSFVGEWEGYIVKDNTTLHTHDSSSAHRTIVEWPDENSIMVGWYDSPSVSGIAKIDSFSNGHGMKYYYPSGVIISTPNSSGQSIYTYIGEGRLSSNMDTLYEFSTRPVVHTNAGMDTIHSFQTDFGLKSEFTWHAKFVRIK